MTTDVFKIFLVQSELTSSAIAEHGEFQGLHGGAPHMLLHHDEHRRAGRLAKNMALARNRGVGRGTDQPFDIFYLKRLETTSALDLRHKWHGLTKCREGTPLH